MGLEPGEVRSAGAPARSRDRFVCGVGRKPDGRIGTGANGTVGTPRTVDTDGELIVPGFCLPLPKDGNLASIRWSATGRRTDKSGEVLRMDKSGRASDIIVPRWTPPRGAGGGATTLTLSSLSSGTKTIKYRTVEFKVSREFLLPYMSDLSALHTAYDRISYADQSWSWGLVSSVDDTLEELWSDLRLVSMDDLWLDFHELIGCYGLHTDEPDALERYDFWGFGWGAPHKVHLWMCLLLYKFEPPVKTPCAK